MTGQQREGRGLTEGDLHRLERLVLVLGIILIVLAVGAVDWRAGALVAGIILVLGTIDLPARTRR